MMKNTKTQTTEVETMQRETKTTDCTYCGRFGLCVLVKPNHWMCLDMQPCKDRQADRCRAYASGFVANTDDMVDGGLVPMTVENDGYDVCVQCGTDTDNGVLHHRAGCVNA